VEVTVDNTVVRVSQGENVRMTVANPKPVMDRAIVTGQNVFVQMTETSFVTIATNEVIGRRTARKIKIAAIIHVGVTITQIRNVTATEKTVTRTTIGPVQRTTYQVVVTRYVT
jgi:hypothetical protein